MSKLGNRWQRLRTYLQWLRAERGMTLIELVLVMALLATLAMIGTPLLIDMLRTSKVEKAIADIESLEVDISLYFLEIETYPTDLSDLPRPFIPLDPWGNRYEYLNIDLGAADQVRRDKFLRPVNFDYDLYSRGPDGLTKPPFTAQVSRDDIVRAGDGAFIGIADEY